MSEEQQTYGQDATDLREAALEVSKARESGQSGVENPQLPAPDEHKPTEAATDPEFKNESRLSVREAAKERLAELEKRREGDEEFARAMGEVPPQEENSDAYQRGVAMEELVDAKTKLDFVSEEMARTEQQAKEKLAELHREIEERKAQQAAAAHREAMLAQVANGTTAHQLEQFRQQKLSEFMQEYPETMTEQGLAQLAKENPYRYAEATRSWESANNAYLAARYQVESQQNALAAHKQASFAQYAQEQDRIWEDKHPEFKDEVGRRALAQVAEAGAKEVAEKFGITREQLMHAYNNDPSVRNAATQEALIAIGRQRLARDGLHSKRIRSLPPVQKPGSRDMAPKVSEQRMAQLNHDLSEKQSVRAAAKLLAERRRAR